MKKNESYVNLILQSPQCNMISPGYKYPKDKEDMFVIGGKKIERKPDNLIKLENMVSNAMQICYQNELKEILEKKVPSLYVDCSNKGDDDIMFFIFKEYIKQSKAKNKVDIVTHAIGRHTIVTESSAHRDEYVRKNNPTLEEMLQHYSQSVKDLLKKNTNDGYSRNLLNFESDVTFNGLSKFMEEEGQRYLYLYLDKVQTLSTEEQQRVNTLLYTRGRIPHDKRIRVKINNGEGTWKTRYSATGHRVEATHDYSSTTIYEEEL